MNQPYQAPGHDPDHPSYEPAIFQGSGRLGRVRYFVYLTAVAAVVYGFLGLVMIVGNIGASHYHHALSVFGAGLASLATLIVTVMGVILGVRRLNDMNASGWLMLLALVPLANFVLALVLLFVPGSSGPNRYGPPAAPNSQGLMVAMVILIFLLLAWAGLFGGVAITTFQTLDTVNGGSPMMHHGGQSL